ncbi:hypothetical protein BGW36DRAFT_384539 [Talaromyces proteolyticus]|uniref:Condensation domain-containing protein n=1 Tax=Talaromyces proteolyticus TaxID=1131652 RepID=A0AAD4KLP6_9EURO|nr:uncharacterized protein BGW36DRAFT_384539 [Talaromyces proteolyticus]KAH8694198.1 hypothetical protein BGW36DRAFT_384539 [Talaromyces proteolyticus]
MSEDWKATSPGRWERPIDSLEDYFVTIADLTRPVGGEHFSLSFGAQIKFHPERTLEDIEAALKQAWTVLRFEHPQLATTVEGSHMVYETLRNESAQQDWLSRTVVMDTSSNSSAELFPQLNQSPKQAVLYYLRTSSEVVIHSSHWRTDGIGATLLLSQLLKHIATPLTSAIVFGSECARLHPSHFALLGASDKPPEASQYITDQSLADYIAHLPSIQIPSAGEPMQKLSPTTHRQEIVICDQQTTDLVASARARGVTLTVVAHAALIHATKRMNTSISLDENASYACICPVSLRDQLPSPYNGPSYAASVAMTGVPMGFTSTNLKKDIEFLQGLYRNEAKRPERIEGLRAFQTKMTTILKQPPIAEVPIPAHPTLNSLGLIEQNLQSSYPSDHGDLEVDKYWIGTSVVDHTVWVYIWTWKKKLTISATYNTGIYDDRIIGNFLEQFSQVLIKELTPLA